MTTLQTVNIQGWFETPSSGIATLYLSCDDEGMTTGPSDTPANTQYVPRVLNPEQFSIKRAPQVWPWGPTSIQQAAYGQLELDNYDGLFNDLLSADLRDTPLTIKLVTASMLLSGTTMNDAITICTAIVDDISANTEDVITITLKDTIARLDKALPTKFNPPYVDSGAANNMVPLTFGACRNIAPLLVDTYNRFFQLHDANIPNVTQVADMAAPLDPNASPPQYTPALNGSGIQLETMPDGKLTAECSSFGSQAVIPGVNDILSGAGAFPGTTGTPGTWTGVLGGADTLTNGAVTIVGLNYELPVDSPSGFTSGSKAYVTDGTNSIYGTVSGTTGSTVKIVVSGATTTGTPNSISVGSRTWRPGAPVGFTWTAGTGSSITEVSGGIYGSVNGAALHSALVFDPGDGLYADSLATATAVLNGSSSYRITFSLYNVQQQQPYFTGGMLGGVLVATKLSNNNADYITGISNPLTTGAFASQNFAFEFTVPAGSARKLYFITAPSAGNAPTNPQGTVSATVFNIKIELLGQYTELPLSGIPMQNYYTEILVSRALEDSSIFNSTEAEAIGLTSAGNVIPWGIHFDSPPNILDALRQPLDNFCATLFTDNLGVLRTRQLIDPSQPGLTIKADFTPANVDRPIAIAVDKAANLTNFIGARRNWSVFGSSDFVTDQAIVPQDVKTRFMRTSQYQRTSSVTPAGQYSFAISAPIFDSLFDVADDSQTEIDRVVSIWSPQIYSDGAVGTGKRQFVTFTARFDDPSAIGVNITCSVTDLMFGDIVQFTYQSGNGSKYLFNQAQAEVVAWELFPFAQKMVLTVFV